MTNSKSTSAKKLSPAAWDALLEALAVFYWYRSDFEGFVKAELAEAPEVLARLNFTDTKRSVASEVVNALRRNEDRYQALVLDLLLRLAEFDRRFPKLARLTDGHDKVVTAQAALDEVRAVVATHGTHVAERQRVQEESIRQEAETQQRHTHDEHLRSLKERFVQLHTMSDAHERGRQFEPLLNDLFSLVDLYPRAAYSLDHEQIDGAFTFQTDDYLLEARWWAEALQPKELNDFRAKVESKAKNVLGLLVAVNGFTDGAVKMHSNSTPLILMDGADLFAVLDGRISLIEVLERKRRHAAETGIPMMHVSQMLG